MNMELPGGVTNIIERLNMAGYEAFAVGGCVRDRLLFRTPGDWDITTQATPQQVKALFDRTVDTGIQHGTVTVLIGKEGFEVTTYRVDGEYEDGRHPKEVSFTASLTEDLKRRDFTINAMAYHPKQGLIDIFGGEQDLKEKRVRCVGEPTERFTEDALRIMRAARFGAQLGFTVEERTKEAMAELKERLRMVSVERIYTELKKLLLSDHPEYLDLMIDTGVFQVVIPELAEAVEQEDIRKKMLKRLQESPADIYIRLALLFDTCLKGEDEDKKDAASKLLRRLKTDGETIKNVKNLVFLADKELEAEEIPIRQFLSHYPEDLLMRYLVVREVETGESPENQRLLAEKILKRGDCVSIRQLAITGSDLLEMGVPHGKKIGEILEYLLNEVLKNQELNEKERLLKMARQKL